MALYALCIGINDYVGEGNDLAGCVNDARDWAGLLQTRGADVKTLLNHQATGQAIRHALRARLQSLRGTGDTLVVTFSGHGSYVPDPHGDEIDHVDECWVGANVGHEEALVLDDEIRDMISARAWPPWSCGMTGAGSPAMSA